jgi:hypothetical protein
MAALFRAAIGEAAARPYPRCLGLLPPAPPPEKGPIAETLLPIDSIADPPAAVMRAVAADVRRAHPWSACAGDSVTYASGERGICGFKVRATGERAMFWALRDASLTSDSTVTGRVLYWGCALGSIGERRCDARRPGRKWVRGRCTLLWQE